MRRSATNPPTRKKPITPRPKRRKTTPRRCPKVLGYRTSTGFSHRVKASDSAETIYAYYDSHETDQAEPSSLEQTGDANSICSVVEISANAAYPFIWPQWLSPDIDYTIGLAFTRNPNGSVFVECHGVHDAFPAYEIIINGNVVYEHRPTDPGPTPMNLGGVRTITVSGAVLIQPPGN